MSILVENDHTVIFSEKGKRTPFFKKDEPKVEKLPVSDEKRCPHCGEPYPEEDDADQPVPLHPAKPGATPYT